MDVHLKGDVGVTVWWIMPWHEGQCEWHSEENTVDTRVKDSAMVWRMVWMTGCHLVHDCVLGINLDL